jgi:hypothetical protein
MQDQSEKIELSRERAEDEISNRSKLLAIHGVTMARDENEREAGLLVLKVSGLEEQINTLKETMTDVEKNCDHWRAAHAVMASQNIRCIAGYRRDLSTLMTRSDQALATCV